MHHSWGVLCTSNPPSAKNTFWRNKAVFGGVSPPVSTGGQRLGQSGRRRIERRRPVDGVPAPPLRGSPSTAEQRSKRLLGWSLSHPPVQSRLGQKFRHGHAGTLRFILDFFHLGSRKSDEDSGCLALVFCHVMRACNALLHCLPLSLDDIAMYFAISLSIHHDTPTRKYHFAISLCTLRYRLVLCDIGESVMRTIPGITVRCGAVRVHARRLPPPCACIRIRIRIRIREGHGPRQASTGCPIKSPSTASNP